MSKATTHHRIKYFDGLRGLLALSVAISHTCGSSYGWTNDRPFIGAYLAVSYFFILSGYVLSMTYNDKIPYYKYILLRFFRLWPLLFISNILMIFIYYHNRNHGLYVSSMDLFSIKSFLLNSSFLNGMDIVKFPLLNEPTWSIGIEFFLSIFFIPVFKKINFYIKLIFTTLAYSYFFIKSHGMISNYGGHSGIMMGIAGMSLGAFLHEYKTTRDTLSLEKRNLLFYPSFILAFIGLYTQNFNFLDSIYVLSFIFVMTMSDEEFLSNPILRFLISPFIQWLGYISFSLYLLHSAVIITGVGHWTAMGQTASVIIELGLALLLSTLVSVFFEHPSYQFLKNWVKSGKIQTHLHSKRLP